MALYIIFRISKIIITLKIPKNAKKNKVQRGVLDFGFLQRVENYSRKRISDILK